MDRKSVIYIGIISVFCLATLYYFYRGSSFNLIEDTELPEAQEQPIHPAFTLSRGALEQASRVPENQDEETNQDELEKSEEDDETEEVDIEAFFDGWTIQRNSLGDIISVTSSSRDKNLPLPDAEDQAGSVLLFAQNVASHFGGSANQIGGSSVTETSVMKHYFFKQVIDGYEVYGGGLQVSVLQDNESVFNINDSIKKIDVANFNRNLNYSREQAWQRIRGEFSSPITQINAAQYETPQLFVRNSVQELAWVFDVRLTGNRPDVRRVVVGGISGSILENLSTIVH